jgi:hypothetical protein
MMHPRAETNPRTYDTPERAIDQLDRSHFRNERVVGKDHPHAHRKYTADWYYYVFVRRG